MMEDPQTKKHTKDTSDHGYDYSISCTLFNHNIHVHLVIEIVPEYLVQSSGGADMLLLKEIRNLVLGDTWNVVTGYDDIYKFL